MESNIILLETATLESPVLYVALSHCWGTSPTLILVDSDLPTETTGDQIALEDARQGIPTENFAKTYKDAIHATRKLGMRHLWIDSLCILQNSKEDWTKESAIMHKAYGNAFCTLAAAASRDGEGGLFHHRTPSVVRPTFVVPHWEETAGKKFAVLPWDYWYTSVSESILCQRGWALQERVLSPRVIHFGQKQVFWECRSHDACETFPYGLPKLARDVHSRFKGLEHQDGTLLRRSKPASQIEVIHDGDDREDTSLDRYYLWSRIVQKYSRTGLSRDSDKLVTIFSLGQHMQARLGDKYIAGLWESILPSQLLWRVENFARALMASENTETNSGAPASTRHQFTAPTWSWASLNGPITMPTPSREGSVINFHVFDGGEAHRGHVEHLNLHKHSMLFVSGALYLGVMAFPPMWDRWGLLLYPRGLVATRDRIKLPSTAKSASPQFYPNLADAQQSHRRSTISGAKVTWPDDMASVGIPCLLHPDAPFNPQTWQTLPIICLPVIDSKNKPKLALDPEPNFLMQGISGLVLLPHEVPGFYQRIGCFDMVPYCVQRNDGVSFGEEFCDHPDYHGLFLNPKANVIVIT